MAGGMSGAVPRGIAIVAAVAAIGGSLGAGLLYRDRDRKAGAGALVSPSGDSTGGRGVAHLTPQALRAEAAAMAAALRMFNAATRGEEDAAHRLASDDTDRAERFAVVRRRRSDLFDRTLRTGAVRIDQELRRRLGPAVVASIVLPRAFYGSGSGTVLDVGAVVPDGTGMSAGFAGPIADAIDALVTRLE